MTLSLPGAGPEAIPPEIGLEKILLFPYKLAALSANLSGGDPTYPISIELSLTSRCNLECRWCSDARLRQLCPDRLTIEHLASLFNDLAQGGTRGVTIEGGGEPTLSPLFESAVRAAVKSGLAVGLITNGTALFRPGLGPELYSLFQWIRISIDASSQQQFKNLKGSDLFEKVLTNLAVLASLKPKPVLGIGYVLTNLNDPPALLQALAERVRTLGADYLHLRPVVDHRDMESSENLQILSQSARDDFSINLGALTDNLPSGNDGLPCLAHSLSAVITADGSVWLCGRLGSEPAADAIGNLLDNSFSEIWSGQKRKSQIKMAATAQYCRRRCPQCRMTKYNRLLDRLKRFKTRDFI
ncbi:MAG: radical SAM protein [Deltaproteobacteria bacterium]|jgi:radical SAM protein with 4Fe4S-binding SPASM domain|nr:radical SAM protein [Deltaproteobacteria bacterium]